MALKRDLTEMDVRYFLSEMGNRLRGRVIDKTSAVEMQIVANVLDTVRLVAGAKLPDATTFMQQYATTIGPLVYLPEGWSREMVVEVATHEFEHVTQFWRGEYGSGGGGFGAGPSFAYLYLMDEEVRVRAEQRALRAQWEMRRAVFGHELPHPSTFVEILERGYALSEKSLRLARDLAEVWTTEVHYGRVDTTAGEVAIRVLSAMGDRKSVV